MTSHDPPLSLPSQLPGGLLADRYRLLAQIAVGGMGEVWRAEDVLLDRTVAVKTMKPEYVDDDDFRARFRTEARLAGGLAHPGIASVYDFGELPTAAWLVMELIEGEPLSTLLHSTGALSPDRTLDVVAQTAAALSAAHEGGVVHRDIKPGNLLVRPDGVVKVTDFGIASAADAVPITRTGEVVGTAYYTSPEQFSGKGAGPASDLYSLGVVAYECLAGVRPFPGTSPVAIAMAHLHSPVPALPEAVPEPVRALVMRLLSKDPDARYPSAAALSAHASALRSADGAGAGPGSGDAGSGENATRVMPMAAPTVAAAVARVGSGSQPHRRAVRSAAVLLTVLALGLGIRSGLAGDQPQAPAPDQTRVSVTAQEWVGRPAEEVRDALAARGLLPTVKYDGEGQPVNTVSAVSPVGEVAVGTAVLLHVVPDELGPNEGDDDKRDDDKADDKRRGKRS